MTKKATTTTPRRRRRFGRADDRTAIRLIRRLAAYGCAGVDQDADDTTLCGTCGPCEANTFLGALDVDCRRAANRGKG